MSGTLAPARPLLDAAVRRDPDDIQAELLRGMVLGFAFQSKAQAVASFENVLAKFPKHEHALVMAGKFHRELGHAERALEIWRQAVALGPYRTAYRVEIGRASCRESVSIRAGGVTGTSRSCV